MDYLHMVPAELWHACWSFSDPQMLCAISLTCKIFCDIAQLLLFRDLEVVVPHGGPSTASMAPFRDLLSHPRLPLLARSFRFDWQSRISATREHTMASVQYQLVIESLTLFQNLILLHIDSVIGDDTLAGHLRRAIDSLPRLRKLEIVNCTLNNGDILSLDQCNITMDRYLQPSAIFEGMNLVDASTISELALRGDQFNAQDIIQSLLEQLPTLPRLLVLKLDLSRRLSGPLISGLLKRTPYVRKLCLRCLPRVNLPEFFAVLLEKRAPVDWPRYNQNIALEPVDLIDLRDLRCPAELATSILPGRPIQSLTIYQPLLPQPSSATHTVNIPFAVSILHLPAMRCQTLHSFRIKQSLSFPQFSETLEAAQLAFPQLQHLRLALDAGVSAESLLERVLAHEFLLPRQLRTLRISLPGLRATPSERHPDFVKQIAVDLARQQGSGALSFVALEGSGIQLNYSLRKGEAE
ncbi:hypothetical protein MIND_01414700 [Mycena indigotica]|uniref:F-box domain-containing protein n=1 Tax=Mycena indigotica TaxID=2126181 RepID=A0A8H6RXY4_9AGAR|nr:uncharacterized protein MIND_01414700 [Mycena indigotica]KAF7288981.1 hypothetical protein MIND_01414700 [Mycena indigotica]